MRRVCFPYRYLDVRKCSYIKVRTTQYTNAIHRRRRIAKKRGEIQNSRQTRRNYNISHRESTAYDPIPGTKSLLYIYKPEGGHVYVQGNTPCCCLSEGAGAEGTSSQASAGVVVVVVLRLRPRRAGEFPVPLRTLWQQRPSTSCWRKTTVLKPTKGASIQALDLQSKGPEE